ncbi:MAG: LptF/LptG family permease [Bacteroidales bacterium]|nr:LptF/LptG family permease [Bacteroidales bacterium]
MKSPKLKILDTYIIKKFLGTYFFAIALIISISIIFDLSEKIDNYMDNEAPVREVFIFYLNFIPYFANLLSSLFSFIAVIFFTSKMAYNSEIIAILSSGVSFRRILVPYFISAFLIASISFVLMAYVIPHANERRLDFEYTYMKESPYRVERDLHMQIDTGVYIYMRNYRPNVKRGHQFSMEEFENNKLKSKLMADNIQWDTTKNKWVVNNYYIRKITNTQKDTIIHGNKLDTTLSINPSDLGQYTDIVTTMNMPELNEFIQKKRIQGAENIEEYMIEKHRRFAFPFSTFILTLIGVFLSSKKLKGGMGMQIGIGITLSFAYILFMRFSSMYGIRGGIEPFIAVWIPNIIFALISLLLSRFAPK